MFKARSDLLWHFLGAASTATTADSLQVAREQGRVYVKEQSEGKDEVDGETARKETPRQELVRHR